MSKISLAEFLADAAIIPPNTSATLSSESVAFLLTALDFVDKSAQWQGVSFELTTAEKTKIAEMAAQAAREIMETRIGMIVMGTWSIPPTGYLECDGSSYSVSAYPSLAAAIDAAYVSAGTITLPDLRGRVPVGFKDSDYEMNTSGGAETHTLTVAEMPEHTHTIADHSHTTLPHGHSNLPHAHTYIPPAIDIDLEDVGVPDVGVARIGLPTLTAPETVTIIDADVTVNTAALSPANSGESEAHENRQPYTVVRFFIVAE